MKKTLVLTESLIGKAYSAFSVMLSNTTDTHFLFFKFAKERAVIAGVIENYNSVIDKLKSNNITYEFIKEDGLDEYFFAHKDEPEIYITPTESISQVISSASLMSYEGKVYVYGTEPTEPEIQNYQPHIRAFTFKRSIGTKGLNTSDATYSHVKGSECTFTIDGKKYTETIKGRENSSHQGVEGYTQICELDTRYRLKIWDTPKKQFEIDKVVSMVKYNDKNEKIGLPLAIIYNDHNNPIGFVMHNFGGNDFSIEKLHQLDKPLIYVKQILEQLIWLESHGFLHRDVNHNIVVDTEYFSVHIIDTDSIQFRQLPASAASVDPQNALPERYETKSAFYNTVDISYTGLSILAAAFIDVRDLFGIWNSNGFCPLDLKTFSILENKAPVVASLIKSAHTTGQPVSLARQLNVVNDMLSGKKTKVAEFHSNVRDYDCTYGDDFEFDFDDDENYGDTPIFNNTKQGSYLYVKRATQEDVSAKNRNINVRSAKETPNYTNKVSTWIKHIILSVFMSNTVVEGVSEDELWKTFIKTGLWKKPLFGSLTAIIAIIVLIIAIVQL